MKPVRYLMTMVAIGMITVANGCGSESNTAYAQEGGLVEAAPTLADTQYVEPSSSRTLQFGEKIDSLLKRSISQPYILQKIGDRTYWVSRKYYSSTFYVGDRGVLLFDPLEDRMPQILEAIQSVTSLPITAVVYSHNHADHIAGIQQLLETTRANKTPLRIIATQATADKQADLNSQLPQPTEIVAWPRGAFTFENLTVELHGFERAAHTDDHSAWLLVQERVLHSPDLLNPDQLPFLGYAGAENFIYHEANLRQAQALDWTFLNGGHGNVGTQRDIEFQLQFSQDLRQAILTAISAESFDSFIKPTIGNSHAHYTQAWYDAVTRRTIESLRPKYGLLYGYDVSMPGNVALVLGAIGSYQ